MLISVSPNIPPLISIITVTYNGSATIGRTLESIDSQTFKDFEHIIIDGASDDDTLDKVAKIPGNDRRKVVSEPDNGIYDAMNKGLGLAKGDYVIFLNSGDKFHSPDSLEIIARTIEKNEYPGIVYGQTDLVDDDGRFLAPRHLTAPEHLEYQDFKHGMLVCHQAFVALRSLAPLFNTDYRFSADFEWCLRCLQQSHNNAYTHATLIDYLSTGTTTANRRDSLAERYRIMAHYYGALPTLIRHVGFAFRFLYHKLTRRAS